MNIEQAARSLWSQVKRCNIWLAIGAAIALGALWYRAEAERMELEAMRERTKQARQTQRALLGIESTPADR